MKITVTAINPDEAVLVSGTSALGWPGKFGCPLVTGEAIFIPARGNEHNLRIGNSIEVETSFDEIDEIRIVPDATIDSMRPLDIPCEYEIVGTVVAAVPQGNVSVSVRGLMFTLERNRLRGVQPQVGQHLAFRITRLTFWDTGATSQS